MKLYVYANNTQKIRKLYANVYANFHVTTNISEHYLLKKKKVVRKRVRKRNANETICKRYKHLSNCKSTFKHNCNTQNILF